jgi:hypothetical protein
MNTNTNTTTPSERREAVRALAVASLAALDGIERAKLADIADIRAKMQDALRWGHGSRLPQSAKLYRKTQQADGVDTWWYRLDGEGEELSCVLHTVFDWITGSNERDVDLDDGMRTLRAAVEYHVRENNPLMSAACAAVGYDEDRLVDPDESPCDAEANDDVNVVNLEDARLSNEIAELEQRANAQRVQIEEITRLVEGMLPARPRHLTLVVSNDVKRSTDSLRE